MIPAGYVFFALLGVDSVKQSFFYTHDALGRMTYDGLSGTRMEYNHMNLIKKVRSGDSTLVNYTYLADGTKLSSLKDSGEGLVYRGPFTYRRLADGVEVLESAVCDEGRLTPDRALIYVTDHLGSVRAVIDGETGNSLEKSDYSVYGQRTGRLTAGGFTCRDHFTGKEDQMPDFGIPYSDHGARQYSPGLRRWMTPDPLSEKYYGLSPYAYCASNPVNAVDPDGRDNFIFKDDKFVKCVTTDEPHKIININSESGGVIVVSFVDPDNDPGNINSTTRIHFVEDKEIYQALEQSGVTNPNNSGFFKGIIYLWQNSNSNHLSNQCKMDYVCSTEYVIQENVLYVTKTPKEGYVAHNAKNYGNFLWGAGTAALGVPSFIAKLGAHVNNFFYDELSKYHLDSKDDQRSIKIGINWKKSH